VTSIGAAVVSVVSAGTVVFKLLRNVNQHLDDRFASKKDLEALRPRIESLEAQLDRVEVGAIRLTDNEDKDFTLNSGEGERAVRRHIAFASPFSRKPRVMVSITRVNMTSSSEASLKLQVSAEQVSGTGFDLVVSVRHRTLLNSEGVCKSLFIGS
jgi:hypothetical protein